MKAEQANKKDHLDQLPKHFGFCKLISKQEYIREVNEAGEGVDVILHLYKDCVDECVLINTVLEQLAPKFPKIKFLKGISDKIVPNFPDKQLPYLLYYKEGKMQKGVQRMEFKMSVHKITEFSIRQMFFTLGVKGLEIQGKNSTVKGKYRGKLGWKRKNRKEEFDSEEDDDRDFITNQIDFK